MNRVAATLCPDVSRLIETPLFLKEVFNVQIIFKASTVAVSHSGPGGGRFHDL